MGNHLQERNLLICRSKQESHQFEPPCRPILHCSSSPSKATWTYRKDWRSCWQSYLIFPDETGPQETLHVRTLVANPARDPPQAKHVGEDEVADNGPSDPLVLSTILALHRVDQTGLQQGGHLVWPRKLDILVPPSGCVRVHVFAWEYFKDFEPLFLKLPFDNKWNVETEEESERQPFSSAKPFHHLSNKRNWFAPTPFFLTTLIWFLKIPFQIGACGKSAARCIPLGSDPTNKLLRRHSGWAVLLWRFAELDRKKLCLVNKGSTCRAGIWKSRWLGRQVTVATQVSINCFSIWKIYTKMISKSPTKSGNGILSGEFVRQGRDI